MRDYCIYRNINRSSKITFILAVIDMTHMIYFRIIKKILTSFKVMSQYKFFFQILHVFFFIFLFKTYKAGSLNHRDATAEYEPILNDLTEVK